MAWQDDLEAGQEPLVKEDGAGAKLKRAVKNAKIPKPGSGGDDLYTDHHAGDPQDELPVAKPVSGATAESANRGQRGPSVVGRFKDSFARLGDIWREALQEAQQRQQEKAARKR